MNMNVNRNVLDQKNYLLLDEMHEMLVGEKSVGDFDFGLEKPKNVSKEKDLNVYLVVFRIFKNNRNVLFYNYLSYSPIFIFCLMHYLVYRNEHNSHVFREWGNYLVTIDKRLYNKEYITLYGNKFKDYPLSLNAPYGALDVFLNSGNYRSWDLNFVFNVINRLIYTSADYNKMSCLIDLAYKKSSDDFVYEIFSESSVYPTILDKLTNDEFNFNIIDNCVFVVADLESFIETIKKNKKYDVNQGPQPLRGQVNSMNSFLNYLDLDFRNSLYNHYNYHMAKGRVNPKNSLDRSNFSFRNIHMRGLGNVRWYSSQVKTSQNLKSNFEMFNKVKNIINNNPTNSDTQLKVEEFLLDFNASKFNKDQFNFYEIVQGMSKEFRDIIEISHDHLIQVINNFKKRELHVKLEGKKLTKKKKSMFYLSVLLKEVSTNTVISLLLGQLITIISNPTQEANSCHTIFWNLGRRIIGSYFYSLYLSESKKKNRCEKNKNDKYKYTMSDWRQENKDIINMFEENQLIYSLGALLIDWIEDEDLIVFEVEKSLEQAKQSLTVIKISERIKGAVEKSKPMSLPNNLPMIVKPKLYQRFKGENGVNKERLGGYLLNDVKLYDPLIIKNWRLQEPSVILDNNIFYSSINNINSVGYKINKDVLNFIRLHGLKYGIVDDRVNHPLKEKLDKGEKLLKWEKREFESFCSIKHLQDNILAIADIFEDAYEFFIPVKTDNRGRVYCMPEYLNYQGTELSKSLLMFSKGSKISKTDKDSIDFLKIFGANCFGNKLDKKSWAFRINWIEDNTEKIRNFYNNDLISKAESKFLFIAFCFEYNKWLDCLENSESTHFITHLPIQLDATCNGYQHLSMLSLDHNLAKQLNLTKSNWNDDPKDFYSYVGSFLRGYFNNKIKDAKLDSIEKESFKRLSALNIHRSLIKTPLMTLVYNASAVKSIKYLKEGFEFDAEFTKLRSNKNLNELEDEDFSFVNKDGELISKTSKDEYWYRYKNDPNVRLESLDFIALYKGLMFVLYDLFPSLDLLIKYLRKIASICTELELYIPWSLPNGLTPLQSYMMVKDVRISPLNYAKHTFSTKIPVKNKYDKKKQMRALMPNLIHSLDAASMFMLINKYFKTSSYEIKNIYGVHDCFAVTANHVNFIMNSLKMIYIEIYSNKGYLHDFDKEVIHNIKVHYGKETFDEKNLEIHIDKYKKPLKYPDISKVLVNSYSINKVKESSYILS